MVNEVVIANGSYSERIYSASYNEIALISDALIKGAGCYFFNFFEFMVYELVPIRVRRKLPWSFRG